MHRLVAYAHNGVQRFVIDRAEMVIGSGPTCDIHLPFAGVGQRHARVLTHGTTLEIEDLGSRKGVVVNGERTRGTRLRVLDEVRLGSIALLVEDLVAEADVPAPIASTARPPRDAMTPEALIDQLSRVSRWVRSDAASSRTLESLITELLDAFGGGAMFLFQGAASERSIKFVVATEARWLVSGEPLLAQIPDQSDMRGAREWTGQLAEQPTWIGTHRYQAMDRPYRLMVALPHWRDETWSPLGGFRTIGDLLILGLVHHVGQFQPIVFSSPAQADLTLASGLVVGESKAMKRVLDELRAVVEPAISVLLRGEPGVAKELLAKSLHLSGKNREGPFLTVRCGGADPTRLAVDLFGAEIQGRQGRVEREGKLLLADGGTLFIDDVERLPLALQSKLVRFLRSGEVEPEGSLDTHKVDVRLITASAAPLESFVARDQVRLDLAHRLSRFAVDVPALRDRREDLPLLIQAAVNRTCHDAGKRVQGITVKALEALAVYNYPGNLLELENIVRRLVSLCPQGKPIDESMLPEAVRLATVSGLRADIEADSDLDLERLVASCERAAIREALRRSRGNKSEAARQLGLSRNGLAAKIKRLGLKT